MTHPYKTNRIVQNVGAVFGVLAAVLHLTAYILYGLSVWYGQVDANIVSWGLFGLSFVVLIAYRDFTHDFYKNLLYIVCSVSAAAIFVVVCIKLHLSGIPIEAKLHSYDYVVILLDILVLIAWARNRGKDADDYIDGWLQLGIFLDFIPIALTTYADPSGEWYVPWGVWILAYALQIVCVVMRWDGKRESVITSIHYLVWHAALFGVIYTNATR